MSTSINVHPPTTTEIQRERNRLKVKVEARKWPRVLKLELTDGGDGIGGQHETSVFIGNLSVDAIRDLASSLDSASEKLLDYARWLKEHGHDKLEG